MRCPACSSSAVMYDHNRGEQVCTRCGLVILERLFELEPEWYREPGAELERADVSTGVDVTQHDLGLGSKFGVSMDLSPSQRAQLRRLQILQQRSRVGGWEDRSLREALVELDKLCEDLALPKGVRAEASVQYRRTRVKGITIGRNLHHVLAAILFVVCRARGLPRTDDEISSVLAARFGMKKPGALRVLRKLTKLVARELKLKLPRISVDDYIDRFAPQLGLSRKAVESAHKFHRALPRSFIQTRSPRFLAAMALYLGADASGEKVTLREVSGVVGVGASSISKNVARVRMLVEAE